MNCNICDTFLDFQPLYYEVDTELLHMTICYPCYDEIEESAQSQWNLRFNCPMDAPKRVSR